MQAGLCYDSAVSEIDGRPELMGQKLCGRTLVGCSTSSLSNSIPANLLNFAAKCSPKQHIFSHIFSKVHIDLSTEIIKVFVSCWLDGETMLFGARVAEAPAYWPH
jgi:hypothetical protein